MSAAESFEISCQTILYNFPSYLTNFFVNYFYPDISVTFSILSLSYLNAYDLSGWWIRIPDLHPASGSGSAFVIRIWIYVKNCVLDFE